MQFLESNRLFKRVLGIVLSALILTGMIGEYAAAVSVDRGAWHDTESGLSQFFPVVTRADGFSAPAGMCDGNPGKNTGVLTKQDGAWAAFRINPPQTRGTVTTVLSEMVLRVYTPSELVIEVSRDGAEWKPVAKTRCNGKGDVPHVVTFAPIAADWVRVVKKSDGWLSIGEIDFWGTCEQDAEASRFNRPGTFVTRERLDLLKQRLATGTHPRDFTLAQLQSLYPPKPYRSKAIKHVRLIGGTPASERFGQQEMKADAEAAYTHALMWYCTGDAVYAENVVRIVKAWPQLDTDFNEGAQIELSTGSFCGVTVAADILRGCGYEGMTDDIVGDYVAWFERRLLPSVELKRLDVYHNIKMYRMRNVLAYSVLAENRYQFNRYVAQLVRLMSLPTESAATGEIRETCGDMNHYSMAVAATLGCAEIAWNQGCDSLYGLSLPTDAAGPFKYRLAAIFDYYAEILNAGQQVQPYPDNISRRRWDGVLIFQTGHKPVVGDGGKGIFCSNFGHELAYNHYVNIKGVSLPELEKRIRFYRTEKHLDLYKHNSGLWGLTHADIDD